MMLNTVSPRVSHEFDQDFLVLSARGTATEQGPHVATRSPGDPCLTGAVAQALRDTGHAALAALDVQIRGATALLRGRVLSYHQKQLAQESAGRVPGIRRIINEVDVLPRR